MLRAEWLYENVIKKLPFNSFWDATGYVLLRVQKPVKYLSIPFGMLLSPYKREKRSHYRAFNSFWDATGVKGPPENCEDKIFQFLLGCYAAA